MAKKSSGMRSLILSIILVAIAFVSYLSVINNGLTKDIAELRAEVAALTAQVNEQEEMQQIEIPQAEAQPVVSDPADQ